MAVVIGLVAVLYAAANAWSEQSHRILPLDVDGYGVLIGRFKDSGRTLSILFRDPSLWKGPVVPFLFGFSYYVVPVDWAPLALNVLAFAIAASSFYLIFRGLGERAAVVVIAVGLWIFYLPHRYIFGYYYSEPILAFFAGAVSLGLVALITNPRMISAVLLGMLLAALLLARAPFLLAIALLLWLLAKRTLAYAEKYLVVTLVVASATFSAWPLRNWLRYESFIPFTTEGGKILFQGVWLPGDDGVMRDLRAMPEWREIERRELGLSPVEQYRFWQQMAADEIRENPVEQLGLAVRKAMRFWVYLPHGSWVPAWKTALVAALALPLAVVGFVHRRRSLAAQIAAAWVGGLWLFHTIVHSELRYNFPVLPYLFLLAVMGAAAIYERLANMARQGAHDEPAASR